MIHPRVQLVTAEVVATMRGISSEHVRELVDGADDVNGAFMWVFNVGACRERSLRFWRRELLEPVTVRDFTLPVVVGQILPGRELGGFQKWEVAELLRVSRRQLADLDLHFTARNGGMYVSRAVLEDFFKRRWLFAGVEMTSK